MIRSFIRTKGDTDTSFGYMYMYIIQGISLLNFAFILIPVLLWFRNIIFGQATKQVMGMTKGLYPAPLKILEVAKTGLDKG